MFALGCPLRSSVSDIARGPLLTGDDRRSERPSAKPGLLPGHQNLPPPPPCPRALGSTTLGVASLPHWGLDSREAEVRPPTSKLNENWDPQLCCALASAHCQRAPFSSLTHCELAALLGAQPASKFSPALLMSSYSPSGGISGWVSEPTDK